MPHGLARPVAAGTTRYLVPLSSNSCAVAGNGSVGTRPKPPGGSCGCAGTVAVEAMMTAAASMMRARSPMVYMASPGDQYYPVSSGINGSSV